MFAELHPPDIYVQSTCDRGTTATAVYVRIDGINNSTRRGCVFERL